MHRQGLGALVHNDQWTHLLRAGATRWFDPGERLIRQHDHDRTVYLLVEGTVKVYTHRPDGAESLLALRGPGESLGEFAALSGLPRTATVAASGGPCLTRALPADRFREMIRELALDQVLWQHMVRRQSESDSMRAVVAGLPASRRLASALVCMAGMLGLDVTGWPNRCAPERNTAPRGTVLQLGLSQQELGEWIGLSRASVAAELSRMRSQGIIRTGRQSIAVLDLDRLYRLAASES
ncbi:Crp/Fnr family transcriptional regulator [Lipingzhangella sp. LS1_29]|uniref:Crp/Fnr family transcriptional regulator n=1 Tax=Lipingzhangella rawalii TaxID=2055835 RepID=A0ABU2H2W7_9ACTN|nr:Crp/Fnr family transcriptional regulator [Lipingzhangella rawalii]MDS1269643.1 Crp/Fnr family transcriptional regulator [Lipingzhangella rawalii]